MPTVGAVLFQKNNSICDKICKKIWSDVDGRKIFPEKYLDALKKFRLIDDTFFSAFFDDNAEDVQYILRIILDKPDLKVLKVQTQKSVENIYGRSVRFDVFATDDNDKLYNIEVQRSNLSCWKDEIGNKKNFPGPWKYHLRQRQLQRWQRQCVGRFDSRFFCENPADMRHHQLAKQVEFLKDNKRGVRKMCKIIEDLFAEELAEGKKESENKSKLKDIRNLMETMALTAEQAMNALKLPADKQDELRPLI